ncbi:hypothetical protein QJS04_geneDACA019324 [Acorus gramineus]|uniref:Uncharacterized protein n=1 Tax=Acorus gramineus TaxID=55184 RepID=A0AAV9ANQ6_ACOGR|nr:hypothetical protein QJS04_geneDACA019324 [Acorus gramineus]
MRPLERETSKATTRVPNLSSLVVRPSGNEDAGEDVDVDGSASGGGREHAREEDRRDRRDPPSHDRSERFSEEDSGYGTRAGTKSPHHRVHRHRDSDFSRRSSSPRHSHGFRGSRRGRGHGRRDYGSERFRDFSPPPSQGRRDYGGERFRDFSPPYDRWRGGRKPFGRGYDEPRVAHEIPFQGVRGSRDDYFSPPPDYRWPSPPRFFEPPLERRGPIRDMNGYMSPPPRTWSRGGPRDFEMDPPVRSPRHGRGGFSEYRGRNRLDWARDGPPFHDRMGFEDGRIERRPLSPPPLPPPRSPRGRWERNPRERSRTPVRDSRRGSFGGRGRGGRRVMGRGGGGGSGGEIDGGVPLTVEPAKPVESPVYQAALDPAAFEVMKSCPRAVVNDLEEKLKEENLYLMTEAGEQGRLPVLILSMKESKLQRRPAIVILHSSYKCKEWLRPLLEALVSAWTTGDAMPFIYDTGFRWAIDNDRWKARVNSIKPLFEEARSDMGKSEIDKEVVEKVWERIAPGLATQFDAPYTIPAIAPRPQLIINGANDLRCPLMGLDIPVSKAQETYNRSNCEENFKLIAEEGIGHRMTTSMVKEASNWFDKFL